MAGTFYGFDERGVRRIRETVQRVRSAPQTGAQRRRQPPVIGGGGGANVIMFQPLGVASGHGAACDVCLCRVVTCDCSSGLNIGDEVTVWDIAPRFDLSPNGFFRMPSDLLFRSFGFAT